MLALAYRRTHGLDVVVTRCSNNYGLIVISYSGTFLS